MFKRLRDRLSERDRKYFKLAVWASLLVWMFFFLVFSVVTARYFRGIVLSTVSGKGGQILGWVLPVWLVFTAGLIIYYVARFARRRLTR
jgi:hypothetical protein